MLKKILIVVSIILVWEGRHIILPALEQGVSYVINTGSSMLQSV